jgi:hypothetical protein
MNGAGVCICKTCQEATFPFFKSKRLKVNPEECPACTKKTKREEQEIQEKKEKERIALQKDDYYAVDDVGYDINLYHLRGAASIEANKVESLVGLYNIIHYTSNRWCSADEEHTISRTVKGKLELQLETWDEVPMLFGSYRVRLAVYDEALGKSNHGSFVQSKHGRHPDANGFNIFDHSPSGKLLFVMERDSHLKKLADHWRSDLLDGISCQDDANKEFESSIDLDDFCSMALTKMIKRVALGLGHDKLAHVEYVPDTTFDAPENLEEADSRTSLLLKVYIPPKIRYLNRGGGISPDSITM